MADVHRRDAELYAALHPTLGENATVLLLDRLPPVGEELATRQDLLAARDDLHTAVGSVQRELVERFDTQFDRAEERADLKFESFRHEMRALLYETTTSQTRTLLGGMAGIMLGSGALAAGLAQII